MLGRDKMIKKLVTVLLSGILAFSLVSCNKETNDITSTPEPRSIAEEFTLEGEWAKDFTKEEVSEFNNKIVERIEELSNIYELTYLKEEKVKEENGETVNDNHIYIDNLNPEPNRMESMYYGLKMYGSDMSQGQLVLKVGFNLDRDVLKEEGAFNFEDTSISSYSECFTGVDDRDYSDISAQIYDVVTNDINDYKIENNLNGLQETISIKDNYLLYRLETKKYNFKK